MMITKPNPIKKQPVGDIKCFVLSSFVSHCSAYFSSGFVFVILLDIWCVTSNYLPYFRYFMT